MKKLLGARHLLKLYNSMNGSSNQYIDTDSDQIFDT
jgi:hypothetical protein